MNALSFSIIDLSAVPYGGFEIWSGSQVQKPPSQNNEIDAGLADSVKMMKYILGKIVELPRAESENTSDITIIRHFLRNQIVVKIQILV